MPRPRQPKLRLASILCAIALSLGLALLPAVFITSQSTPTAIAPRQVLAQPATRGDANGDRMSDNEATSLAEAGWLVINGRRLFQLQSFEELNLTGGDRVLLVSRDIEEFLSEDALGNIPLPVVKVELVDRTEHVITLSDRELPQESPTILFTVTRQDAAVALGRSPADETVNFAQINNIASEWAETLEIALRAERRRLLAISQARQPLSLALGIVSAIAILTVAYYLLRLSNRAIDRLHQFDGNGNNPTLKLWIDTLAFLGKWIARLAIALTGFHLSVEVLPILVPYRQWLYQRLEIALRAFGSLLIQPIVPGVSILSVLAFLVFASAIFLTASRLSEGLKERLLVRFSLDLGARETIATILKYLLTLVGTLLVLPLLGIDLSSLTLIAGAVGLGIGIGLQNLTNNFISGIVMLFERPIQVGDFIEVDDLLGTVERVSLRATVIRTLDSINVIVPNARIMESNVISWSYRDPRFRLHVPISVAYGIDTELVKEILLAVAIRHPRVLNSPAPQVLFQGFGDSSLNFELLVWSLRPNEQFNLSSDMNFAIESELRKYNIEIPFPQRDLHLRSAPGLREFFSSKRSRPSRSDSSNGTSHPGDAKNTSSEQKGK